MRSSGAARGMFFARHVQQDDALVKHLVVLEIVQKRHRNDIDPAGHVDGGAPAPAFCCAPER